MSTESAESAQETATFHGGRLIARRLKAHGVSRLFTLSGGHLFSIYDGCREEGIEIVDVRHESTAAFAAEGWAKVTREPGVCALTAGPGRDERHERDGLGAGQPLADGRARRPRAGAALGAGLAAGDRPRAVRAAADQARGDAREHGGDPGSGRRRVRRRAARRTAARRSSTSRSTTCSWRRQSRRARANAAPAGDEPRGRRRRPSIERAAELLGGGRAPGDHGRHGPLLGPRRGGAAGARRDAADPGVPQRPRARLRAGRPRAVLLARPLTGAERRRCRARDRRADGLPARLRRLLRRGHRDRRDRLGRARARATREPVAAECYGAIASDARGPARGGGCAALASEAWIAELRAAETERREARARRDRGRPRPASPDAAVRGAGQAARPRRDRDRRRRRLRLATPAA